MATGSACFSQPLTMIQNIERTTEHLERRPSETSTEKPINSTGLQETERCNRRIPSTKPDIVNPFTIRIKRPAYLIRVIYLMSVLDDILKIVAYNSIVSSE